MLQQSPQPQIALPSPHRSVAPSQRSREQVATQRAVVLHALYAGRFRKRLVRQLQHGAAGRKPRFEFLHKRAVARHGCVAGDTALLRNLVERADRQQHGCTPDCPAPRQLRAARPTDALHCHYDGRKRNEGNEEAHAVIAADQRRNQQRKERANAANGSQQECGERHRCQEGSGGGIGRRAREAAKRTGEQEQQADAADEPEGRGGVLVDQWRAPAVAVREIAQRLYAMLGRRQQQLRQFEAVGLAVARVAAGDLRVRTVTGLDRRSWSRRWPARPYRPRQRGPLPAGPRAEIEWITRALLRQSRSDTPEKTRSRRRWIRPPRRQAPATASCVAARATTACLPTRYTRARRRAGPRRTRRAADWPRRAK